MKSTRLLNELASLIIAALIIAPWLTSVSASNLQFSQHRITTNYAPLGVQPLFADFDGDALPDKAVLSPNGQYKNIYISLGSSQMYSLSFDSGRHDPGMLVSNDVDHDSDQDLVWYSRANPQAVFFWLNDGKGGFGSATLYRQSEQHPDLDLSSLLDQDAELHLSDQQQSDVTTCVLRTADSPVVELAARRAVTAPAMLLRLQCETHRILSPCLNTFLSGCVRSS